MTFDTTYRLSNATVIVELEEKENDTYTISMKVEIGEEQKWILRNYNANAENLQIIAWGVPHSKKFNIRILRNVKDIEDYVIIVELMMREGKEAAVVIYKDTDSYEMISLSKTGEVPEIYFAAGK